MSVINLKNSSAGVWNDNESEQSTTLIATRELMGWKIPEHAIQTLAYDLWTRGFSDDADTNWFEAERLIKSAVSK